MPITAGDLIVKAFFYSEVNSVDLNAVNGSDMSRGLVLLNDLLSEQNVNGFYIPYFTHVEVPAVTNQERYFVENLIEADVVTFDYQTIRYTLTEYTRKQYFGVSRPLNIQSLPYCYTLERCINGSFLYVFFQPDSTQYTFNITGKFFFNNVVLQQDLSLSIDRFYIQYLTFKLAELICAFYEMDTPPIVQKKLSELSIASENISIPDLSVQGTILGSTSSPSYAFVNLSNGWLP